ncbi:MAG: DEAD/DEAH box helicase family protein [Victivallaceae bacterium]|nr:DEAD/DEAH box helicase family protein [Victivallaceae bacterium]
MNMFIDYYKLLQGADKTIVVVPTKVLQQQWRDNFIEKCGVAPSMIQLHGGNNRKSLNTAANIHIFIINTAVRIFADYIPQLAKEHSLLLLADECHRYGSEKNGAKIIIIHELIEELEFIASALQNAEIEHIVYHSKMGNQVKIEHWKLLNPSPKR